MFFSKIFALVAVAAVAVTASPVPLPLQRAVARNDAQVVREVPVEAPIVLKRQQTVPEQAPAMSLDGGPPVPFSNAKAKKRSVETEDELLKRQQAAVTVLERSDVPEQDAATAPDGTVRPYGSAKRSLQGRSVQPRSKAASRRDLKVNRFPLHLAARSDGGEVVAFRD